MRKLREYIHQIEDRTFILREVNGKRRNQLDDLSDQAVMVAKRLDECPAEDIEKKREIRQELQALNRETYRTFLIPFQPDERTPDDWIDENITEGYFMNVVAVLQGALNRYEDVAAVGKSIAEKLGAAPAAETNGLSVGPIFAAH